MNVRDARPSDLDALVPLHLDAFAGSIGAVLGRGYARALLAWFIGRADAAALVAEDGGRVVGYVLGAPDGYSPQLTRDVLPSILRGAAAHLPRLAVHPSFMRQLRARATNLVLRREPHTRIHDATPPGCFNLVAIGARPDVRGRGVGRALVDALCARARARGFQRVLLDVFADNTRARHVYERSGFRTIVEDGGVIRMVREPAA